MKSEKEIEFEEGDLKKKDSTEKNFGYFETSLN